MSNDSLSLRSGSLCDAVTRTTEAALASGALERIDTEAHVVVDGGVRFVVRRVSSLTRKPRRSPPGAGNAAPADPFLPHDPALFVTDISSTHRVLLNKYPVLDRHLLIVTRDFENQEDMLGQRDFQALAACMTECNGLAFYNAGRAAGASQDHKHLQLAPLRLGAAADEIPIQPLLREPRLLGGVGVAPLLPFRHAYGELPSGTWSDPRAAGDFLLTLYRKLCRATGIEEARVGSERRQSGPYNLLLTREWMLLVPRSRERFDSISINALAFAGSLFVKDAAQLERVRQAGPIAILREVSSPD